MNSYIRYLIHNYSVISIWEFRRHSARPTLLGYVHFLWSRGYEVGIRTSEESRFIPLKGQYLPLIRNVQTVHSVPSAPTLLCTGVCFLSRKAAGMWSWQLVSFSTKLKFDELHHLLPYALMVSTGTTSCVVEAFALPLPGIILGLLRPWRWVR
jgi:hypothetical protein